MVSIILVFHGPSFEVCVTVGINHGTHELFVHVFYGNHIATLVDERTGSAVPAPYQQRRYAVLFAGAVVVGAEGGGYMYHPGSIFCGYEVAGNHTEGSFARIDPVEELPVFYVFQFFTLEFCQYLKGKLFVPVDILFEFQFSIGIGEIDILQCLGQHYCCWFSGIWIDGTYQNVFYVSSYGQSGVRRKRPRSRCPGHNIHFCGICGLEQELRSCVPDNIEKSDTGGVFDVAVAAGQVEFV